VGNPDNEVRDTVTVKISYSGYREAEETAKLGKIQRLLKKRVVGLIYRAQSCAVDEENLSNILWCAKPIITGKISILERRSDYDIRNSVTIKVTDDRDALPQACSAIFRLRILH